MTTTSDRFAIASDPQPLPQSGSLGPGLAERRPIEGAAAGVGPAGQAHPAPPPPPQTAWMGGTMDVPPLAPPPQAPMQALHPQVQQPGPAPAPVPLPPAQPPAGWHRPGEGAPPQQPAAQAIPAGWSAPGHEAVVASMTAQASAAQPSAQADPFAAWRALPPDVRAKLVGFLGSAYQPAEMQAAALVLEAVAAGAGSAPPAGALELVKAIDDLVGGAHAGVQQLRRVLGGG